MAAPVLPYQPGRHPQSQVGPVTHYTKSQRNHRYNAIKRGYWVYEDWSEAGGERYNIYYDADTERSQIFEKNLVADGFNVIDGSNL